MRLRVVLVLVRLKTDQTACRDREAVKIAETVEHPDALPEDPVQPSVVVGLMKRGAGVACERCKRIGRYDGGGEILVDVLGVEEEKELVLDNRVAKIASVLIAGIRRLERRSRWWRPWKSCRESAAAEKREAFTVEIIRSRTR